MNGNILESLSSSWPQALEAGMLLCFATSWPIAIMKMLKSKRAEGKSLGFVLLVFFGYLFGIAAKASYAIAYQTSLPAIVWLYVLNSLTVGIDASLYVYYSRYPEAPASLRAGA
jgi:hypothetical protein